CARDESGLRAPTEWGLAAAAVRWGWWCGPTCGAGTPGRRREDRRDRSRRLGANETLASGGHVSSRSRGRPPRALRRRRGPVGAEVAGADGVAGDDGHREAEADRGREHEPAAHLHG